MMRSLPARRGLAAVLALAAAALAGGAARAASIDFSLAYERTDGDYLGDDDVRLTRVPLDLIFGGPASRFIITVPYVRLGRTGNVTFMPDGPAILGAGGPGRPAHQTSPPGEGESGLGDVVLRNETYLVRSGQGKRPALAYVLELKLPTADESKGLGTGERDWGAGLRYVQPLSPHWQFLGDAFYRYTGSPEGLDFKNQLRLGAGLGLVTRHTTYRLSVENLSPVLDRVPVFPDPSPLPFATESVDDRRTARFDILRRSRGGGTSRLSVVKGLNDSSEDLGIILSISTAGP